MSNLEFMYQERPDLDLQRSRMWDNRPPEPYTRWEDYEADQDSLLLAEDFSDDPDAITFTQDVIKRLVRKGGGTGFYYNSQLSRSFDYQEYAEEELLELIQDGESSYSEVVIAVEIRKNQTEIICSCEI